MKQRLLLLTILLAITACTTEPGGPTEPHDEHPYTYDFAYSVGGAVENNDLADYAFIVIRDTVQYEPIDTVDMPESWSRYQVSPAGTKTDVPDIDYARARSGRLYAFELQ